jgi:hypothetical protein
MAGAQVWCRVAVLGPGGAELARFTLAGPLQSGLAVVDRLARLRLAADRCGRVVVVRELCPEMEELLDLAGLSQLADPGDGAG